MVNFTLAYYRTTASCEAAMRSFDASSVDVSRLEMRLVKSTRGDTLASQSKANQKAFNRFSNISDAADGSQEQSRHTLEPAILNGSRLVDWKELRQTPPSSALTDGLCQVPSTGKLHHHPEMLIRSSDRYFILESLSIQDLQVSVGNGLWSTHSRNESLLNEAFEGSANVYLIFSDSVAGEFTGYARMASRISRHGTGVVMYPSPAHVTVELGTPRCLLTVASNATSRGRIVDDATRDSVSWAAYPYHGRSDAEGSESRLGPGSAPAGYPRNAGQGLHFDVQWLSTITLPMYRTRGLRNAYDSNREVKFAGDGTELEPSVGRELLRTFYQARSVCSAHRRNNFPLDAAAPAA